MKILNIRFSYKDEFAAGDLLAQQNILKFCSFYSSGRSLNNKYTSVGDEMNRLITERDTKLKKLIDKKK